MADPSPLDVDAFLEPLTVDSDRLHRLARRFSTTYQNLARTSTEQFLPTPITNLPSGKETGKFLAIDLGGTNLRVGFIELLGRSWSPHGEDGQLEADQEEARDTSPDGPRFRRTHEKSWPIGEHLKIDKAEDLFAWIGDCISEVVAEDVDAVAAEDPDCDGNPHQDGIALGITFSFPMLQNSLAEATLMPMGKGFAITSNLNLGKLLLSGYERHTDVVSNDETQLSNDSEPSRKRRRVRKLPRLRIAAISNDTVATLAAMTYAVRSRSNNRVAMGLIVGTGTNATIPMKLRDLGAAKTSKISFPSTADLEDLEVVVNTEWTINGTAGPLRELGFMTKWDDMLDEASEAPGFQPFEYMTAGRYLGELARLCVLDIFTNKLQIPEEDLPSALRHRNSLTTTFLAQTVVAEKPGISLTSELQHELPPPGESKWQWTDETSDILRKVGSKLQIRSAGLIAAAVIGLLGCTGNIYVGDGTGYDTAKTTMNGTSKSGGAADDEVVIASTGGVITHYPGFFDSCQGYIDELLRREGHRNDGKRIVLQEALDGGIIGAGVLAGTVANLA
ncbi:MAG: hypothetical protein M1837_001174 [Sclerophora amabilis]|nr:MAG: hypothetical protein M1837_001174 [Sclerophora amabilis]